MSKIVLPHELAVVEVLDISTELSIEISNEELQADSFLTKTVENCKNKVLETGVKNSLVHI